MLTCFCSTSTDTTEIYTSVPPLSLHDPLPTSPPRWRLTQSILLLESPRERAPRGRKDRGSSRSLRGLRAQPDDLGDVRSALHRIQHECRDRSERQIGRAHV